VRMGNVRLSDGARSEEADAEFRGLWGNAYIDRHAMPRKGILKNSYSLVELPSAATLHRSTGSASSGGQSDRFMSPGKDAGESDMHHPSPAPSVAFTASPEICDPATPTFHPFDSPRAMSPDPQFGVYQNPAHNTSAPSLTVAAQKPSNPRSMTVPARKRIIWAPECAVYSTYDAGTYDRRSEPATCNRLTPQLAMEIKQELNAFKLEMTVHPSSRGYTHYFP